MGKIIIHAGMGKAGSTSIQEWLREHGEQLQAEAGVTTLTATVDASGRVRVEGHTRGTMNSFTVMRHCAEHPEDRRSVLDSFFAQLDQGAHRHGAVVLSAEIFGRSIALKEEDFVRRLNELGSSHDVHVAYYVRPQHAALESGWRHWRSDREKVPSEYIQRLSRELHHLETLTFVRDVAPRVRFVPRPCRRDLLHGGDVVADFAHVFVGVQPQHDVQYWENRGLPLDVASALSSIPGKLLWPPQQDPVVLDLVRGLVTDPNLAESDQAHLAHLVLQQACHERFEDENREMIAALGWETNEWVPAVDTDIGEASFERMNGLWRSSASAGELAVLHRALAQLVEAERLRKESERLRGEVGRLRASRSLRAAVLVSRALHPLHLRRKG